MMLTNDYKEITVKNADGDADTTATIIIQNKIDYIPKVSVIIPVYNVEQYLHECLDSVVNQTLKEIEIICVDDGSTDKSLEILKEYAAKDNRITVITQENLHAGVARNAGLSVACGEYIHFLDSDDYVSLDTYAKLYEIVNNKKTDIIKFCSYCFDNKKQAVVESYFTRMGALTDDKFDRNLNFTDDIDTLVNVSDAPWSGLYRRKFLKDNNIRYDNFLCANDVSFFYRCIVNVDSVYMVKRSERFVYYRINNASSLIGIRAYNFDCQINQFMNINKIVAGCDGKQIDIIRKHLINALFFRYDSYLNNLLLELEARKKIFNQMKGFIKNINESEVPESYKFHYYALLTDVCISVIVPVYNTERYLVQCLNSILNQNLYNVEVICVNDGSTDNSLQMLQQYTQNDERIKIINNTKNSGSPGVVKNIGIKSAVGDYIGFVDSDDWVDKNYFSELYDIATKNNADMASCLKIVRFDSEHEWPSAAYDVKGKSVLNTIDEKIPLIKKAGSNCIKLYKTKFIRENNLKCWEQRCIAEDNYLSMLSMLLANKIAVTDKVVYHYRRGIESVTSNKRTDKDLNVFDVYTAIDESIKRLPVTEESKSKMLSVMNVRKTQDFTWFCRDIDQNYLYDFKTKLNKVFPVVYKEIFDCKDELTSYTARIETLNQTIDALLKQTFKLREERDKLMFDKIIKDVRKYRIDIRYADKPGNVDVNGNVDVSRPGWMNGCGVVILTANQKQHFDIKTGQDGKLMLYFRGNDYRHEGTRFPVYITYKSIKIDGLNILKEPVNTWHDRPFVYELHVKNGQNISIDIETSDYDYSEYEFYDVACKTHPSMNIDKQKLIEYLKK